jgi:L-2-hydroxyglutarate oxidase LhgO
MKNKTTEKIFKELGHKFQNLNDLYICILKDDIKEIKKKYEAMPE